MRKITEFPPLRANLDDESKLLTPHPSTKLFDEHPALLENHKRFSEGGAKPIRFPLTPVPAPRMTRSDKWRNPPRPAVARYYEFANTFRLVAAGIHFELPHEGAKFVFHIPMPKSWSNKRRKEFNGRPHRSKPDIDNLVKCVLDALLPDDCMVWQIAGAEKRWAERGAIEISVTPVEEAAA